MITDSMNLYELPEFLHDSSLLHKHEFSPYQSTYQSRLMYVRIKIPVWYWFVTQDYLKLLLLCTVSHFFKQQLLPTLSNIILYTAWSHPRLSFCKWKLFLNITQWLCPKITAVSLLEQLVIWLSFVTAFLFGNMCQSNSFCFFSYFYTQYWNIILPAQLLRNLWVDHRQTWPPPTTFL